MKVAIVGAGKLGIKVAQALISGDNDVILVDKNKQVIQKINESLDILTIAANGISTETLNEIQINTYDVIIACTESDEKNIIICTIAKRLGCKKAVARVRDPEYVEQIDLIMKEMHIDHIVNPDLVAAKQIFHYLVEQYTIYNELFVNGKVTIMEFNIEDIYQLHNEMIQDIAGYFNNLIIVAISRNGKIIIPNGKTVLQDIDILYLLGSTTSIAEFSKLMNVKSFKINAKNIKRVMILGGGKTSFYLAQALTEMRISVKIIEVDREQCKYLSENLNNTLVIHGDGTDVSLLEEENIQSMDAFIALTGFDEENLLISLTANLYNIPEIISKVSRQNYVDLIQKLGINMAINPVNITASNILRFIQGRKLVAVSQLLQGQAESMELIANSDMPIVNKPIFELDIPKGIIIGCIVRDGEVIIPNGHNVIKPNDRVVIFFDLTNLQELEKF
ncbi:MAG: Trk system potassium transporter TrkA, partial [Peptostreptococcales bacterium]